MDCDICMIVNNSVTKDARVRKEATSLASRGWNVLVIGMNSADGQFLENEKMDGYQVIRVRFPQINDYEAFFLKTNKPLSVVLFLLALPLLSLVTCASHTTKFGSILKQDTKNLINSFISLFLFPARRLVRKIKLTYENPLIQHIFAQQLSLINARIYHAHDFPALLILEEAGLMDSEKVVYDSHELFFDRTPPDSPVFTAVVPDSKEMLHEGELARKAAAIITVGDYLADIMSERWKTPRPLVIRNTTDLRTAGESEESFTTKEKNQKIVVHSGNITYGRHLSELVDSLIHLPQNVVIVLMGTSRPYVLDPLMQRAKEIGVLNRVHIEPAVRVENIAPTLKQADLGVALITISEALSYRYSLPNKFFDYIAAGIPILCSRAPEMVAIVEEYKIGLACDETDPAAIANAIKEILEPANYAKFKRNVLKARKVLNWENEEKNLVHLYESIFESP